MKFLSILLAFIFTACNPLEIEIAEELTSEAILIEKELLSEEEHPYCVDK